MEQFKEIPDHKRQFVSNIFYLTLGSHYAQIVGAVSGVVIRIFIGPTLAGLQALLTMIYYYFDYLYSPFRGGLAREVPYYKGLKDEKTVEQIRRGSFSIILFITTALSFALWISSYLVPENETGLLRWSLRVFTVIGFCMSLTTYLIVFFRTEKKFFALFKYHLVHATVLSVGTILASYLYSFKGLLLSILVIQVFCTLYFFHLSGYRFRIYLSLRILKLLVVRGAPVILYSIFFLSFKQVDRLLVVSMMGLKEMGYYSIGLMMCNLVFLIPSGIWDVVFPGFLEKGAHYKQDVSPLKSEVFHNTRTVCDVISVFFPLSAFAVQFLIMYALKDFRPGIAPAQILILGTYFIGIHNMFFYLFVIRDRMRYVIVSAMILFILAAGLDYIAIRIGTGMVGVAFATYVCFLLFGGAIIFMSGILLLRCSLKDMASQFLRMSFPYLLSCSVFYPVNRFLCPQMDSFWKDVLRGVFGCLAISISCLPFWIHVDKQTRLISTLISEMKQKFRKLWGFLART